MIACLLALASFAGAAAGPALAPVVAKVQSTPALQASLRKAIDALPASLQKPDMGLRDLQKAKGPDGEAQRLALGLFARPDVLLYHREELGAVLGAERLRALEFAVETYHQHAVANPAARGQLLRLSETLDLADEVHIEDLAARLDKAFDGAPTAAAAVKLEPASLRKQALAPSSRQTRAAKPEPPEADAEEIEFNAYEQNFMDSFIISGDGRTLRAVAAYLKPYLPAAVLELIGDEDDLDGALDESEEMRRASPGPHGPN